MFKLYWALILGGVLIMGFYEYHETALLSAGIRLDEPHTFKAVGYANLLLLISTALYFVQLWRGPGLTGKLASIFATVGTVALSLNLAVRWMETYYLHRSGHVPFNVLYEMLAVFSIVTLVIYLVMERVFRTRIAGAFVMSIVMVAVLFQIWLTSTGQVVTGYRFPVILSYWKYAHVLGNLIGVGAFAVAAAMGAACLSRYAHMRPRTGGFIAQTMPTAARLAHSMHFSIMVGFPAFTVATVLGAWWAYEVWGTYWAWRMQEILALAVWLIYASYFYFRHVRKWSDASMARWAILGFAAVLFLWLGVTVFWRGPHAFCCAELSSWQHGLSMPGI